MRRAVLGTLKQVYHEVSAGAELGSSMVGGSVCRSGGNAERGTGMPKNIGKMLYTGIVFDPLNLLRFMTPRFQV